MICMKFVFVCHLRVSEIFNDICYPLQKLNLDLVQFPSPVYISEIRIIPLGARVQADFPGKA